MRADNRSALGVALVVDSRDAKLVVSKKNPRAWLRCAATYRPIDPTCRAEECASHPSRKGGTKCYAYQGNMAFQNRRLEGLAKATGATALQLSLAEARLVREFAKAQPHAMGLDLRMGVSGEVSGPKGARALADAAALWLRQVGGQPWGYTHAWKRILRSTFGGISMLASVDSPADIPRAKARGYVPAIVLDKWHENALPFTHPDDPSGTRFIRCPSETMGMACVECRLCLDDARLKERGMGIAFANKRNKKKSLPMLANSGKAV